MEKRSSKPVDPAGVPPSEPEPPAERRQQPTALLRSQDFENADPKLAYEDALTGVHNRRLLDHLFRDRWEELIGANDELSLVMVDVDAFKEVNDRHGHLTGDEVLKVTAGLLSRSFRQEDFLVRYGGDEFVVVAPGSGVEAARRRAGQARRDLEASSFAAGDRERPTELNVSFSIGAASFPHDGRSGEALLRVADERLYGEKRERRGAAPRATPPPRALTRNRKAPALAVAAALVIVVAAAVWQLSGTDAEPTPAPAEVTVESIPAPAPGGPDAEELKARIHSLENEVRSLAGERSVPRQAEYERRIERLEGYIRQLQAELAERNATAVERDEPADSTAGTAIDVASEKAASKQDPPGSDVPEKDPRDRDTQDLDPPVLGSPNLDPPDLDPPNREAPESEPEKTPVNAAPPIAPGAGRAAVPSPPAARSESIAAPELIRFPEPEYPRAARKMRRQATVELRLMVDADGTVLSAEPVGPKVGLGFEAAARQAAFKALFKPGTRDGVPVVMETTLKIRFRLNL